MGRRRCLLLPCLLYIGCMSDPKRTATPAIEVATLDGEAPYLKAHLRDGRVFVLSPWRSEEEDGATWIRGEGRLLDVNRSTVESGPLVVPIDSVALFETNVTELSPAVAALSVMTGVTAGVAAFCAANPKTCFGSCPTFYAHDGQGQVLLAEGFSASIAPALEATDVDALVRARPSGSTFPITMTNEALETHVVRTVELLALRRPPRGRVFLTAGGAFHPAPELAFPVGCRAVEGDCLERVRVLDGRERFSTTDSTDLATREVVDLVFPEPPGPGPHGLVLASRQSLLSTYLLYQAFAYLGTSAGGALAAFERRESGAIDRARGLGRLLGGIEVSIVREGREIRVDEIGETGPIAIETRVVPLPPLGPGPVTLRLRLTRGHWRVDWVALARLDEPVEPLRLRPTGVRRGGVEDPAALALLLDPESVLVTRPGDRYTISFDLPDPADGHEVFLESRGYYLEWMRREWMTEENPWLAARMLLDPADALRRLAPAFKAVEPEIERSFWNSRYAP